MDEERLLTVLSVHVEEDPAEPQPGAVVIAEGELANQIS